MTVFLTPDGEPFFGGTYFPPEPRHGLPAFKQVLLAVSEAWTAQRREVAASSARLSEHIRSGTLLEPSSRPADRPELLAEADRLLDGGFDETWGGWGGRRSSRPRACSSSCSAAETSTASGRRSTGWRPAACTTSSAAASTATRSTHAGSCRTSRRCSTTTRCSPRLPTRLARCFGDERYRASPSDARLRAARARARRRRVRLRPGRRHRRRRRADVHVGAGRGRARRAPAAVRGGPLRVARRARRRDAREALRAPRAAGEAGARRQGDRVVERPRARGVRPVRTARRADWIDAARGLASSCSGSSRRRTGGFTARGAPAARRERATSRTTPTSPTG